MSTTSSSTTTLSTTFCLINVFLINSIHFVLTWIKFTLQDLFNLFIHTSIPNTQSTTTKVLDSDEALFYATLHDEAFQQRQKVKFDDFNKAIDNLHTSQRAFIGSDHASMFSKDPYSSHFPDVADIFSTNLINKNFRLHFE